jgi:hypothetical protein
MLSVAARPTLALTVALPTEPNAPELRLPGSAGPQISIWLDSALAAGDIEFISVFAELSIARPVVPMVAVDPVPEAMPEAEVKAAVDVVTPDNDATGADVLVDAVATEVSGAEAVNDGDSAELSGDTVCALEPAEVVTAWATAAA